MLQWGTQPHSSPESGVLGLHGDVADRDVHDQAGDLPCPQGGRQWV
jgi:hypothetical protein